MVFRLVQSLRLNQSRCEVLRVEGMTADGEIHDGGVPAGREGWGIGRGFGGLVIGWFGVVGFLG